MQEGTWSRGHCHHDPVLNFCFPRAPACYYEMSRASECISRTLAPCFLQLLLFSDIDAGDSSSVLATDPTFYPELLLSFQVNIKMPWMDCCCLGQQSESIEVCKCSVVTQ